MDKIAWLQKLISFDTTSRNSNLELIHHIADWLKQYHIQSVFTHNTTQTKANLFATIPARDGEMVRGGWIFSGHTDVVPVDGQEWESDPFVAKITEEKVFGRGACDMKGFIAVLLSLVPEWVQTPRDFPLHLAFSYDEEVGCLGVPALIADFCTRGIRPAACIVGEPTDMHMVVAHKGIQVYRCSVQGLSAHSSLTTSGCNAIEYAAELVTYIRSLAEHFKKVGPFDADYNVAFSTITVNQIRGGIADNIIPNVCEFVFEMRNLPENVPEKVIEQIQDVIHQKILPKMQAEYPEAKIELENLAKVPGLKFSGQDSILALTQSLVQEKSPQKVSYATEAGLFQHAGIPTIVCGPGNIAQAHRPNEFVTVEQLQRCEEFLRALANTISVQV